MLEKEFIQEYAAQATQAQRAEVIKTKLEPLSPKLAGIMSNLNEGKTTTFEAINEMRQDYKKGLSKGSRYIEHEGNPFTDKANQIAGALPIKRSEYAFEVNRINAAGYLSPNERDLFNAFIKESIDEKGLKDGLLSIQADKKAYTDKLNVIELSGAEPFNKRHEVLDLQMEFSNKGSLSKNQEKAIDKIMTSSINDQLTISNGDIKTLATIAEYHGYAGNVVSNNLLSVIEAQSSMTKGQTIAESTKTQAPANGKVKRDLRQEFTDKLIASLEQGVIPWRKPWNADKTVDVGIPSNALTGKPYRGGNLLMLAVESADKGYQDNRWATFNQVKELGGNVMKGQSATPIEYWERRPFYLRSDVQITENGKRVFFDAKAVQTTQTITSKDGRTLNKASLKIENDSKQYTWRQAEAQLDSLVQKTHFVFNVEQAENLKLPPLATELPEFEKNVKAEAIAQGMQKDGVTIVHRERDAAFYVPAIDTVQMPVRSAFEHDAGYYGTLLHELGHATGHEERLNRDHKGKFGSELYAKEELVAEITSAFTSMETGIPFDGENHKAYVKNWAEVIKEDKNAIYVAARDASKASDYLIEKGKEVELELKNQLEETLKNEVKDEKKLEVKNPVKETEQIVVEMDQPKPVIEKDNNQNKTPPRAPIKNSRPAGMEM